MLGNNTTPINAPTNYRYTFDKIIVIIIIIIKYFTSKLLKLNIYNVMWYDYRLYVDAGVLKRSSYAHLASTNARTGHVFLQRLSLWSVELFVGVDDRQPETKLVGEVMACPSIPVALDERRGTEIFQTWTGAGQRLTAASSARARVLRIHQFN